MRASLATELTIQRLAVFAEFAWFERRPELGVLCRAARPNNALSVSTVQSALPGVTEAGARNVLAWCEMLGLCDSQGSLTRLGAEAAEDDEVPVPEQGTYDLWIARHPMLGCRILAAVRMTASREPSLDAVRPAVDLPPCGEVFRSIAEPRERFVLRKLAKAGGSPGCVVGNTEAWCRLRWDLDFDRGTNRWHLEGELDAPSASRTSALRPVQHAPESDEIDLRVVADAWGLGALRDFGRWDAQRQRLAVRFEGLSEDETEKFLKTIHLASIEVPGRGSFGEVVIEDLSIGPSSDVEAQDWASARLRRRLSRDAKYRPRHVLRALFAELTEETPLEPFAPALPSHTDLLTDLERADLASYWSLAAPVDLSPHVVPASDLDVFRVGADVRPSRPLDEPGHVRIPHGRSPSMREIAQLLVAGSEPIRALLCDRYVRGPENLATLELLVSSLRSASAISALDVWAGDKEFPAAEIERITSARPRRYTEVFQRDWPHDRYLLIALPGGGGFGWQMSNSPLHARPTTSLPTGDSPLRWKDFVATKLQREQLHPAMQRWFIEVTR